MAKNPLSRIHQLSARIEEHLHQFAEETDGDETATAPSMPEMKKRKKPLFGTLAVAGAGAAAVANKDKIKSGYQAAKTGVQSRMATAKEAGRTAAFRGMRGTADVMKKGSKVASKVATETSWKHQGVRKGAASVSDALAKGAKKLRKKSMKFFSAADLAGIQRIEAKFRAIGV